MSGPSLRLVCINDVYSLENLPRLATLVRKEREASPADAFLVILAGDFIGPSILSSLDKGRGMIDCLNEVGVTHVVFGNHEDDVTVDDLRARIREFRGTWLNTNVPEFTPTLPTEDVLTVVGRGGRTVNVALVGVVMHDAAIYRRPPFGGSPVTPANETVLRAARRLVERGCDAVIPITHQPLPDDRALASTATPRFPVIVGGHEHEVHIEDIDGTWLVKAGTEARDAAIVDLVWPDEARPEDAGPTVAVRLESVFGYDEDPALRARVDGHMRIVRELEHATLVHLTGGATLSSVGTRAAQTSLGTMICSRIRDALEAEVCVFNGGGIRGNRDYHGAFTFGDLKAEVPFDNEVVVVSLPGCVLADAIATSRSRAPAEFGGFLQVDDRTIVDPDTHRLVAAAGRPFEPSRSYRVATILNLFAGMDHVEPLAQFGREHADAVPKPDSGRGVKMVLVDAFSRSLFQQLGPFEAIDANGDGVLSPRELADALERLTAAPASPLSVNLVLNALDGNGDRLISAEEAGKVRREPNG